MDPIKLVSDRSSSTDLGARPMITFVRGPIISSEDSLNNEATPCVAFAYLAGYLRKRGYDTHFVDSIAEGLGHYWRLPQFPGYMAQGIGFDRILAMIPKDTQFIAVSAMFSGEWPATRTLIKVIREHFPKATIIAGGEHITALTEFTLKDCPEIDYCVRGEGEYPLYELLETLLNKGDVSKVGSVAYFDDAGVYHAPNQLTRIKELQEIPWPHWPDGYLEKFWAKGKSYGVSTGKDMPFMVSRGCPYQCTFCSNPQMWSTRYILRDVEDAIAEIKTYIKKYQITGLQFYDLTAITVKKWTLEFCNALIRENLNVKWSLPSGTRSEALDQETLQLLKQTGCNYLVYAPETGSQKTADKIKKRIKLPQFTKSVFQAKKIGLVLRTNLIIGFPHETRWDIFKTVAYGLRLAIGGVDEVSINIFSPYPGSEIFKELFTKNKIDLSDKYFLALASLNSDYSKLNHLTANENMGPRELAFYRISFMLTNYMLGYVFFPSRIFRSLKNIFSGKHEAATVFEHRLKDRMARKLTDAPTSERVG